MDVTATQNDIQPGAATPGTAKKQAAESGKALPPAGNTPPPARHPTPALTMEKAVEQIRRYLRDSQRQLDFQFDESSGRTIIKVINPVSGEVIRQIPSEEVLQLAAALDTQGFRTFDALA